MEKGAGGDEQRPRQERPLGTHHQKHSQQTPPISNFPSETARLCSHHSAREHCRQPRLMKVLQGDCNTAQHPCLQSEPTCLTACMHRCINKCSICNRQNQIDDTNICVHVCVLKHFRLSLLLVNWCVSLVVKFSISPHSKVCKCLKVRDTVCTFEKEN